MEITLQDASLDNLRKLFKDLSVSTETSKDVYSFMGMPVRESKFLPVGGVAMKTDTHIAYFNIDTGIGWVAKGDHIQDLIKNDFLDREMFKP